MNYTIESGYCGEAGVINLGPNLQPGMILSFRMQNDPSYMPGGVALPDTVGIGCFKYIGTSCTKAANGGIGVGDPDGDSFGTGLLFIGFPNCASGCGNHMTNNFPCTTNCGQL